MICPVCFFVCKNYNDPIHAYECGYHHFSRYFWFKDSDNFYIKDYTLPESFYILYKLNGVFIVDSQLERDKLIMNHLERILKLKVFT